MMEQQRGDCVEEILFIWTSKKDEDFKSEQYE